MRVDKYTKFLKNLFRREKSFFQQPSWQLVEILERFWGVWLHQNRFKNYLMRIIFLLLVISAMITIVARLIKEWGVNLGIATENFTGILIIASSLIKLIACCTYDEKRQNIYERVNHHFRTITDPEEAFVLRNSAEHSMKFCIKYMILYFVTEVIFLFILIAKMIFQHWMNNSELEKILPYYADYGFIDEDKYYVPIMLQILSMASFFIIATCSYDFALTMNVRHVCALFEIVNVRLREASGFLEEFEWDMLDFTTADNKAYELITRAIDLHNEAFEMVSLIDENYRGCLFILLLANAFLFSGGVYLILLNLDQPFNLLRYFTFFVSLFTHFFLICSHGQRIITSSSSVFDACYNVKWYLASTKTRTLLLTMMSRCSRPCEITGGSVFVISMESCGKLMKGGYSYLSVFTRK